jgi:hypothetical protein
MGGSGYNLSLSVGRAARGKATTRTPVHFYLDVPLYTYELPCVDTLGNPHTFRSRTPIGNDPRFYPLWCERCQVYQHVNPVTVAVEPPPSTDEPVSLAQDKGIMRERVSSWLGRNAYLAADAEGEAGMYAEAQIRFGLSLAETRRLFAGITMPASRSDSPDKCRAGTHLLTEDNIMPGYGGRGRQCRTCFNERRRANRKAAP